MCEYFFWKSVYSDCQVSSKIESSVCMECKIVEFLVVY